MLKFVYYSGIIIQTDLFLNNMMRPRISGSKEEEKNYSTDSGYLIDFHLFRLIFPFLTGSVLHINA